MLSRSLIIQRSKINIGLSRQNFLHIWFTVIKGLQILGYACLTVNTFSPLIQQKALNRFRVTLSFCSVVLQYVNNSAPVHVFALQVSDIILASGICFQSCKDYIIIETSTVHKCQIHALQSWQYMYRLEQKVCCWFTYTFKELKLRLCKHAVRLYRTNI